MKKIQIVEAVIDFFDSDQAGEHKAKYHPGIIKVHLNNVFNQIVYNTWLNGKKYFDFSQLDAWSKTYTCNVQAQIGTSAYALLPFAPIQLPDGMGIRQVCDHSDSTNVFAMIEATADAIFNELEISSSNIDDKPTFRMEQNNYSTGAGEASHKLVFGNLPTGDDAITSVDVLLLVPMDQMDDYDDIVIPGMQEDTIVRQIIDLMIKKPKPDLANDNVIE